ANAVLRLVVQHPLESGNYGAHVAHAVVVEDFDVDQVNARSDSLERSIELRAGGRSAVPGENSGDAGAMPALIAGGVSAGGKIHAGNNVRKITNRLDAAVDHRDGDAAAGHSVLLQGHVGPAGPDRKLVAFLHAEVDGDSGHVRQGGNLRQLAGGNPHG